MEFLLTIAGAVALLIWGTHQVTQGVMKGFGPRLRAILATGLSSPLRALSAGFGVTLALQSSTATALMASSFSARGALALAPGYWLMLGANLGTAMVARLLAFPIHLAAPILLLVSIFAHRHAHTARWKFTADASFGLGLMLLALRMLSTTLDGVSATTLGQEMMSALSMQPLLALFVGILAAWLCHSSVAVVLVASAWASTGTLPPNVGLAIVLGANLGGALGPVLNAESLIARRLPVANLLVRSVGVAGGGVMLGIAGQALPGWISALSLVDAHLLFNAVLLVLAAPFANYVARLLVRLLPTPPASEDIARFRPASPIDASPALVLAAAEREALRTAERFTAALESLPAALGGNASAIDALARIDRIGDEVTALGSAVREWLGQAAVRAGPNWVPINLQRAREIDAFVLSLEHAADILAHQVGKPLRKRYKQEGALPADLSILLLQAATACQSAHTAACAVLIGRDPTVARELIQAKRQFRMMERNTPGIQVPAATALDPDLDDALRLPREVGRIISQSCAVAYEVLENLGERRPT